MRLIDTTKMELVEFLDDQTPPYAILSHRWASPSEEISYSDFSTCKWKKSTSGYLKVHKFCRIAKERNIRHCWVDTCCIDKSSSAELSEAINSMYAWYERASVCFAYLSDVSEERDFTRSQWFQRGWTLQELIAPGSLHFFDSHWRPIGSRNTLKKDIASVTGIDEALLVKQTVLSQYSVAQRMSWAAHRKTTRLEDEAYCLMGLFGVNMPLLYGERSQAFRRLQQQILASVEDTSLFAWGHETSLGEGSVPSLNMLAPSPTAFEACGDLQKGFASQRILFEVTNLGIMISIHRSYNRAVLNELLQYGRHYVDSNKPHPIRMTIPLSCYRKVNDGGNGPRAIRPMYLYLALDHGEWRRAGVVSMVDRNLWIKYHGKHYPAYANDYIRIYIRDQWRGNAAQSSPDAKPTSEQHVRTLYLQDVGEHNMDFNA